MAKYMLACEQAVGLWNWIIQTSGNLPTFTFFPLCAFLQVLHRQQNKNPFHSSRLIISGLVCKYMWLVL